MQCGNVLLISPRLGGSRERSSMDDRGPSFEAEVLEIARERWPDSGFNGPGKHDGREFDGKFITEEAVHIIFCTVSDSASKATGDGKRLLYHLRAARKEFGDSRALKGWFIT